MTQLDLHAAGDQIIVQPWSAPAINDSVNIARRRHGSQELEAAEHRARQAAEAAGRAAGLEAARVEIEQRVRQLDAAARNLEAMLQALSRPLAHLDDEVHGQIALLATALARALLRRELRTDPGQIIAIVRETVALLPAVARGVRVVLHPDDAAIVRERLSMGGPEQAWSIVDDPVLSRGDCRVHTDYAQIDARIEARLGEALAQMLGEDRVAQRDGET